MAILAMMSGVPAGIWDRRATRRWKSTMPRRGSIATTAKAAFGMIVNDSVPASFVQGVITALIHAGRRRPD